MSTFEENFERDENKDMQFDTNAFYPVLESSIILFIFYSLYKIYSLLFNYQVKYQDEKKYRNCQCKACKQRLNNLIKKKSNKQNLVFYIGLLCFLILAFSICYKKILETQSKVKSFDPYEILEISNTATVQEIRKAYKKLAIKYHPDKNINNLQAKAKFMLISKAYESLTNEEAKKNYEMYGNPDGPGSMRFSIGLPSAFILNKKNHFKILIFFIIIVSIIIPYYFVKWFKRSKNFDEYGLLNITKEYFMKKTNTESETKNIPFILGTSHEFFWIEDKTIDDTANEINGLFDKYKTEFPTGQDAEKIINIMGLRNKKAIAIAYAYSYGDREDPNYLKLEKKNEYIILIAKLIDAFFDSHNAKNLVCNICHFQGGDESKLVFPKVKTEFLNGIIMFQQCFYQGIPIQKIQTNISYVQLPYINTDNIQLIAKSDENIKFSEFLKKSDENKKIFLKKVFNFTDEQIAEIIDSTHSIPQYEYKIKYYVDGYEDTDIIPQDIVTYKITVTRKNVGKLTLGIGHSKYFPGLFNECLYFNVLNGDRVISQEKVLIEKKVTEYKFPIKIVHTGKNVITFSIKPSCTYGLNEKIEGNIECIAKSEKRNQLMDSIKKRKVKLPLSLLEEALQSQGFKLNDDSDDDEEEEEEPNKKENKKEEVKKENENEDKKEDKNEDKKEEKKEENKAVKEESVKKEN
jgi:translocation protein SEC63